MSRKRRRKDTKLVAIAIQLDQPYPHLLNCYHGIMRFAKEKEDWQVVVDPHLMGVAGSSGIQKYDGIVGRVGRESAEQARDIGIPVVNHWLNSPARDVPGVFTDFRQCGRMAAEHLLSRGFHQIGCTGFRRDRARKLFLEGLAPPLEERNLRVQTIEFPFTYESNRKVFTRFHQELREWLAKQTTPLGLFSQLDAMSLHIIQTCGELGLRVPHDVGIVSNDNIPTICLKTSPTLSSIEADNEQVGYRAAELLDRLISGEAEPAEPIWIPPRTLRVRGSSDAFVCEDTIVSEAMRFIADHAKQAISVEDVARAAKTSKRTLVRRFNEYLGRSVRSEIRRLRTETIKRVLIDEDASLSVVARECGFATTSHFSEYFRKETRMTPGEFRKQLR